MAFENLVALQVKDEAGYAAYRAAMIPILEGLGGKFRFDFGGVQVLKGESPEDSLLNRAFVIQFPDRATRESFFSDPAYLQIREKHFAPSVGRVVRVAEYER